MFSSKILALSVAAAAAISSAEAFSASMRHDNGHGRSLFVCGEGKWKCTKRGWWNVCLWGSCQCEAGYKKDWAGRCTVEPDCPTPTTQSNVNLDEWTRATWYIQKQQENEYQPKDKLFCVSATYRVEPDRKVPFFSGKVISVYNYANEGKVNGKPVNGRPGATETPGLVLCGRQPDSDDAAKLVVAPCFLPNALAGDYWILGAGPSPDNYEWAVVSGGKPTRKFADGCTTKKNGINGSGLWIFTREPTGPEAERGVAAALDVLREKGYATSQLIDVPQEGCTREGALIEPNNK